MQIRVMMIVISRVSHHEPVMQECSAGGEFDDRREYFKYGSKEINCLAPPSVNKKYKSNILLLFTENKQKNFPLSIHFI